MIDTSKFDRNLQNKILHSLYDASPQPMSLDLFERLQRECDGGKDKVIANMLYLIMHELITDPFDRIVPLMGKVTFIFSSSGCVIKAKGIDFLLDDGGLGAILNVQTVKFHSDTIESIESIINRSDASAEEKKTLKAKLRELPEEGLKHLTNELISKAIAASPAAYALIHKYFFSI